MALRIPGPLGTDTSVAPIDAGTIMLTTTPTPGPVGIVLGEFGNAAPSPPPPVSALVFDIDKAVKHLDAHAHKLTQRYCARYVREAMAAGGVIVSPQPKYAKDYGPALARLGFKKLAADLKSYVARKGDIAVIQPPKDSTEGHLQMYNGTRWESDFIQGQGFYPGPVYRKEQVPYEIYRP